MGYYIHCFSKQSLRSYLEFFASLNVSYGTYITQFVLFDGFCCNFHNFLASDISTFSFGELYSDALSFLINDLPGTFTYYNLFYCLFWVFLVRVKSSKLFPVLHLVHKKFVYLLDKLARDCFLPGNEIIRLRYPFFPPRVLHISPLSCWSRCGKSNLSKPPCPLHFIPGSCSYCNNKLWNRWWRRASKEYFDWFRPIINFD